MKSESETHFRFLALKNRLEAEVIQHCPVGTDLFGWSGLCRDE